MKYAFLLSNWYSGATLLSLLLNSNKDLICNGETFPFNLNDKRRHSCSCGEFIDECSFYQESAWVDTQKNFSDSWDYSRAVILPRFHKIDILNRYLSSPLQESKIRNLLTDASGVSVNIENFLKEQEAFYENASRYKGAKMYIDGTKSIRRLQLFANTFSEKKFKVIHLVRDGRAFCNSFRKNRKKGEKSLLAAANEWNEYIKLVDDTANRFHNIEIKHIKYEDLCSSKELTLNSISEFLDFEISKSFKNRNFIPHVLGNRMRKNFSNEVKEDITWKQELSEEKIKIITKKMKRYLDRFEYR